MSSHPAEPSLLSGSQEPGAAGLCTLVPWGLGSIWPGSDPVHSISTKPTPITSGRMNHFHSRPPVIFFLGDLSPCETGSPCRAGTMSHSPPCARSPAADDGSLLRLPAEGGPSPVEKPTGSGARQDVSLTISITSGQLLNLRPSVSLGKGGDDNSISLTGLSED